MNAPSGGLGLHGGGARLDRKFLVFGRRLSLMRRDYSTTGAATGQLFQGVNRLVQTPFFCLQFFYDLVEIHRLTNFPTCKWGALTRMEGGLTNESPSRAGAFRMIIGRCPTLPHTRACSTIGAERLNFRVRDGNGWNPLAMITRSLDQGRPR